MLVVLGTTVSADGDIFRVGLAGPAVPRITPAPNPALARRAAIDKRGVFEMSWTTDNPERASQCSRAYTSLIRDVPVPTNSALVSWIVSDMPEPKTANDADNAAATVCTPLDSPDGWENIPETVAAEYSTYMSSYSSWIDATAKSEASSLATSCGGPMSPMFEVAVETDMARCTAQVEKFIELVENSDKKGAGSSVRDSGFIAAGLVIAGAVGGMALL